MKSLMKRHIFLVLGLSFVLILLEIFTAWKKLALVGAGFILIILSLFINLMWIKRIIQYAGLFLIIVALIQTQSIWLIMLVIVMLLILFKTEDGNALVHIEEGLILPISSKNQYVGIKLIEAQSKQRVLLQKKSIFDLYEEDCQHLEWDDVNLVYFGGNNILDFGNTLVPNRETTVVIRKFYGRTRILIPNDIALKLNCSLISGGVVFESQRYQLNGENFLWASPNYFQASRQINLIVSVVFGDVEVILT